MLLKAQLVTLTAIATLAIAIVPNNCTGQSVSPPSPKVKALQAELNLIQSKRNSLRASILALQDELQALQDQRVASLTKQDSLGISMASFPEIIKSLQTQRVNLLIDLAGLEARRNALEKMQEVNLAENTDSMIEPLAKILVREKQSLSRVKQLHNTGSVSHAELANAEKRVLQAEVRIAEARNALRNQSGLGTGLLDTALERAEKKARLVKIETLLESYTVSRSEIEETARIEQNIDNTSMQIQDVQSAIRAAESKLSEVEAQLQWAIDNR